MERTFIFIFYFVLSSTLLQSIIAINLGTSWRNTYIYATVSSIYSVEFFGDITGTLAPTPFIGPPAASSCTNVAAVYSNMYAITLLKNDGSIICWGSIAYGGKCPTNIGKVKFIAATNYAFAALLQNGQVVSWGTQYNNGPATTAPQISTPSGIGIATSLYASPQSFAAIMSDGSVISWGLVSGSVIPPVHNVISIQVTFSAFAAVTNAGAVVTWGEVSPGTPMTTPAGLSNVVTIYSNTVDFAALSKMGTVTAWGASATNTPSAVSGHIPIGLSGVTFIASTLTSFAAIKGDGTIVAWGAADTGGTTCPVAKNTRMIFASEHTFVALDNTGAVKVWGGGVMSCSTPIASLFQVSWIFNGPDAFTFLNKDTTMSQCGNSTAVQNAPTGLVNIVAAYPKYKGFVAIKGDGTALEWGKKFNNLRIGITDVGMVYTATSSRGDSSNPRLYACNTNQFGRYYQQCASCMDGKFSPVGSATFDQCVTVPPPVATAAPHAGFDSGLSKTQLALIISGSVVLFFGLIYYWYRFIYKARLEDAQRPVQEGDTRRPSVRPKAPAAPLALETMAQDAPLQIESSPFQSTARETANRRPSNRPPAGDVAMVVTNKSFQQEVDPSGSPYPPVNVPAAGLGSNPGAPRRASQARGMNPMYSSAPAPVIPQITTNPMQQTFAQKDLHGVKVEASLMAPRATRRTSVGAVVPTGAARRASTGPAIAGVNPMYNAAAASVLPAPKPAPMPPIMPPRPSVPRGFAAPPRK